MFPVSAGISPGRRGCQKYRAKAEFAPQHEEELAQRITMVGVSLPLFLSPLKVIPAAPVPLVLHGTRASSPQAEGAGSPAPFTLGILILRQRSWFTSIFYFTCLRGEIGKERGCPRRTKRIDQSHQVITMNAAWWWWFVSYQALGNATPPSCTPLASTAPPAFFLLPRSVLHVLFSKPGSCQ